MAGHQAPVGPFPEGADPEAYDRLRRRVLWQMPSGLYVVGSHAGERYNLMTLNWATQVAFDPKLVAISVEKVAVTHELVSLGRSFSLNLIDREDRALVRKFVKPVDRVPAGLLGGCPFRTVATGAPVLERAIGFLDCGLRQSMDVGSHTLFVGEVVEAGFQKNEDTEVLRTQDTRMSYGG